MTSQPSLVRLGEADRPALERHFLALEPEDRSLRFGAALGDDGVRAYVERIDLAKDGVFAIREGDTLAAVMHAAFSGHVAELGLSVLPGWRLQGLGNRLFDYAVGFVHGHGTTELFVHCRSDNGAMMHLARKHRMRIADFGDETDARVGVGSLTRPATRDP